MCNGPSNEKRSCNENACPGKHFKPKKAVVWSSGQCALLLSNDVGSNPAEVYSFFCKILFDKNEYKQK